MSQLCDCLLCYYIRPFILRHSNHNFIKYTINYHFMIELDYNRKMSKPIIEPSAQASTYQASIKIIGKFPLNAKLMQGETQIYRKINLQTQMGPYCPELAVKPEQYTPMPKKIFVEGNLIAIIDQLDNLWFICNTLPYHINVSLMLGRKARYVSLSQNECIINNKKNPILLNWGAKKILDANNLETMKLNQKIGKNICSFFNAFSINSSNKDDKYLYSNTKKVDNSNKLYQLGSKLTNDNDENKKSKSRNNNVRIRNRKSEIDLLQTHFISAFPTLESNLMKNRVVGISVGKFHCMCWDTAGLLYTWGSRSLALGYEQLPHEKITTKPRVVKKLYKFVTMGFAATHYSLALSSDGNVYEWGIKKQANQLNQELIFDPKILQIGENGHKIIMLKGKENQMACLNSKHQLFIWGEKVAKLLPEQIRSRLKSKYEYIYTPFLVPNLEDDKIIDFGIGEQFIAVLTSKYDSMLMAQEEKVYWNDMLKRVKSKLKLTGTVKTQAAEIHKPQIETESNKFRNSESELQLLPLDLQINANQYVCNVQKSYQQRNLKKQYFKSLKKENKFYINLLKYKKQMTCDDQRERIKNSHDKQNTIKILSQDRSNKIGKYSIKSSFHKTVGLLSLRRSTVEKQSWISKFQHSPFSEQINAILLQKQLGVINAKKYINSVFSETFRQATLKGKKPKDIQDLMRKGKMIEIKKLQIQPYSARLERVRQRKKSIEESFNQQISKRVEENSIQYRTQRHELIIQAKFHEKNRNMLKQTLQAYLIKHYLIKMIIAPIQQARRIKIQQFAKSLHLCRIQKNLRKIFVKARIKHGLQKLRHMHFTTYALLCHVFKRYVKRRRQNKTNQMRKIVAEQLYKNVLKEKIRLGLSKAHLNTRKLQKFRQWLVTTKIERIKCLKILWKNHLLSIMKISTQADTLSICKTQDNCNFQSLYKQKLASNPMLQLQTFLNKSPIFQLRSQYFQSIIFLFRKDNKVKSQKILKGIKNTRKKLKIKFSGQQPYTSSSAFTNSNDLLPYSLHYNILVRPKSMEINILQNMKKSQNWIKEQRSTFEKCLKQIIDTHQRNFLKARRKYDIDLAKFIKQKYDSLAEKRWKCIIQYNKLKKNPNKSKKQKQLYRLFDLIGMQKTLNQDCLPQKYLMLEQALKKRDAPTPPNRFIVFGLNQFKQIFKKYYESISYKAKVMRSRFVV